MDGVWPGACDGGSECSGAAGATPSRQNRLHRMSSSAFAVVPGPVTGPTAPARGGKADARAASDDRDFATALRDLPTNDVAPGPVHGRAGRGRDVAALANEPLSSEGDSAGENASATAVTEGTVAAAPRPHLPEGQTVGETPAGSIAGPSDDVLSTRSTGAVDLKAQANPTADGAQADPSEPGTPQEHPLPASAEELVAAKIVAPPASERARDVAASPSALLTPVRPAKAASAGGVETVTPSIDGADAPSGEGDAPPVPPPAAATSAPVEPGRVRDVIDRSAARAATDASSTEGDAPAPGLGKSSETTGSSSPSAATPKPSSPSEAAPPTVPSTSVVEEAASTQSGAASQPTLEAQAAEAAQTPGLSTLSRTAVETTAQIAAQIVRRLEGRSTRFDIALTPEGLGRVDVSLDIEADGSLRATLAFDNPVAATDLRGRADELRRQLTDAGFTLADDALSFADRDPSAGQGDGFNRPSDRHNARAFGAASRLSVEADLSAQASSWIQLSLTPTGVDMKV